MRPLLTLAKAPAGRLIAGLLVSVVALALILSLGSDFLALVLATSAAYAITVTGLNLLTGTSGQLSFGHNAFFAVGAYAAAILVTSDHLAPFAALIAGAVLAAAIAALVGYPITRLRGHYLSMATLALGLAAYEYVANAPLTHGFIGISVAQPLGFLGVTTMTHTGAAGIAWGFVLLAVVSLWAIRRSRFGKALEAIRDNEDLAVASGLNVPLLRMGVFVISAVYAAVGGALLAFTLAYISPELFSVDTIATLFMMMYLGGTRGLWGALIAAAVITAMPQELSALATWEVPVFGTFLILYLIFQRDLAALPRHVQTLLHLGGDA